MLRCNRARTRTARRQARALVGRRLLRHSRAEREDIESVRALSGSGRISVLLRRAVSALTRSISVVIEIGCRSFVEPEGRRTSAVRERRRRNPAVAGRTRSRTLDFGDDRERVPPGRTL